MGRTGKRTWIKLHTHGMLHGSVSYQLSEAEQAIWVKLLCLAGECNRDGQISDNDGRPYPHLFISHEIHTTLELLETTLHMCTQEGRITEDESGIHITNWSVYQSEYQRQLPYRQEKKVKIASETLYCTVCGYATPYDQQTKTWEYCPLCTKKGKKSKLEKRTSEDKQE